MTQTHPHLSRHTETNGGITPTEEHRDGHYVIRDAPLGMPRPIRIVTVGAGASGINMIRTLRRTLEGLPYEHVVYEKNSGVGGTWFENRYPGCRCDVPSHSYQFSWRQKPDWSNFFAPAEEIEDYLCRICEEEDLVLSIKTSHKVVSAVWNDQSSLWKISVLNVETGAVIEDSSNFLIDAGGILNKWNWPDIPGIHEFKGELIHTAAWPEDFRYEGKTVAVIGNGASGVQVLPAIVPHVNKIYHHIRTPTWILPPRVMTMKMGAAAPVINQIQMDEKENFTSEQIERFKSDTVFYETFTKALDVDSNLKFALSLMGSSVHQQWASAKCREFMTAMLGGDEKLCEALIPKFPIGCRRLTPAPGYLEALRTPKVEVITDNIARVTPEGIETGTGEIFKVDAIICATGFDNSFCPAFPLIGRRGNLQDIWKSEIPKSYLSLGVAGMPNYFKFLGPNAPIAHGDVFTLSEQIATYMAKVIRKCQTEGIRSIVPSDAAVDEYFEHVSTYMPRTAWAGSCRSWYKNGEIKGRVIGLHPGSRLHFIQMLSTFRGEDFEYEYDGPKPNRFAYLGNGFTAKELEMMAAMKQA